MRSWKVAVVLAAISLLLAVALAAAQEPVRDFTQLNTRLTPGDTIWVTDARGREVKGRIVALGTDAITLEGGGGKTFAAPDVATITVRRGDSLGNGALIGFGVGAIVVGVACVANTEGEDQGWCLLAAGVYGGIGTAIGVGIDAMIPGKKLVAYRTPASAGSSPARLSIVPMVTPRAKGVAVSFSF